MIIISRITNMMTTQINKNNRNRHRNQPQLHHHTTHYQIYERSQPYKTPNIIYSYFAITTILKHVMPIRRVLEQLNNKIIVVLNNHRSHTIGNIVKSCSLIIRTATCIGLQTSRHLDKNYNNNSIRSITYLQQETYECHQNSYNDNQT